MKKFISLLVVALFATTMFSATLSYKNNTYQKLADEYTRKADRAMDAGLYDEAVEYSKKAEENAVYAKKKAYEAFRKYEERNKEYDEKRIVDPFVSFFE